MLYPYQRLSDFLSRDLWAIDRSSVGAPLRFLLDLARLVVAIGRDVLYGQITLWAMGLVYTSLLSLVPLLAVAFSVLKAFGAHNTLEPVLLEFFAPLGDEGVELTGSIMEFVNNIKVGVLGTVGLGLLMYTVMSLIQKVEGAFNAIWKVRGMRSITRRFSDYLSVVLVGPVLVLSAMALTATLVSTSLFQKIVALEPLGSIILQAGKLIPYVLICAAFTFVYMFIPYTRVRFSSALVGGGVGGVLWETVGWGFASFIASSTKYAAIYSSFAIVILFLIWLYVNWLILLIGVAVCFYYQNPQQLSVPVVQTPLNTRFVEQAAVSIMFLIASHFHYGKPPWTENALIARLGLPIGTFEDIVTALKKNRLITETDDDPPAYLPARDIETILLQDVYKTVRQLDSDKKAVHQSIAPVEAVDSVMSDIDQAIQGTLGSRSVKDIIDDHKVP